MAVLTEPQIGIFPFYLAVKRQLHPLAHGPFFQLQSLASPGSLSFSVIDYSAFF